MCLSDIDSILLPQNYPYSARGDNNSPPNAADQVCTSETLPYSLKFSRLKIFAVFAGCTLTTKILSREIFSTCIRIRTHAL